MNIRNYNKIAKEYHKKTQSNFYNAELELPAMLKILKSIPLKNKKVLDLGCGTGRYTKILLSRKARVWGIDSSEQMIKIAKMENPDARLRKASLPRIPFKSNFFDIVVSALCLDHIKDIQRVFRETNRVLKNGGLFIFSRNNPITEIVERKNGKYIFNNYFKEGKRKKFFPSFNVNMTYYHITFETLIKAIIKTGFVIEDYIDAKPRPSSKTRFPNEYNSTINKPYFCIFKLRKPATP